MSEFDERSGILLEVTVPENASPRSTITVQSPDGRFFEIVLPDKVEPGDVITVMIPHTADEKVDEVTATSAQGDVPSADNTSSDATVVSSRRERSQMTYQKAAAITAGVVVGSLVVGPILTGIVVVGAVVASSTLKHHAQADGEAPGEPTLLDKMSSRAKELDEQNHISETVKKVGAQAHSRIVEIDQELGVSAATGRAIVRAKQIDEQNKISETVTKAVSAGVDRAREFDQEHKVSEKVAEAGAQAVQAARELDAKYEVSAHISNAFALGAKQFSSFLGSGKQQQTAGTASGRDATLDKDDIQ